MPSVNKIIQDKMIGHQVGLLRLSSGITNKLVTLLNQTEDNILTQLRRLDNERLNVVLKNVREVLNTAKSGQYEMLKSELTDLSQYEPKYVKQLIKDVLPVKFNMTMPSTDMLSSIVTSQPFQGKLLKEWVDDLSDSARRGVRDTIRMGMVQGQTIDQMAQRIRGTRALQYKDGLMEINRRGAQAMVRTAVNHTATNSRELMFAQNEELIKEVQWVSTLDARTTPFCQGMDGRTFPVNEGERPPGHINCRSVTVPVVKSFRELGFDIDEAPSGTRASLDGQVSEKTTYNDWLKGQSVEMQNSILGPGRAEMFRGGMRVDKFVDYNSGKPFTLAQLAGQEEVGLGSLAPVKSTNTLIKSVDEINFTGNALSEVESTQTALYQKLTAQEKDALINYIGDSSIYNTALRSGENIPIANQLDSVFNKVAPLEKDIVVRRLAFDQVDYVPKVGDSFIDKGFMSTTGTKRGYLNVLEGLTEDMGLEANEIVSFDIYVPKGVRALSMNRKIGNVYFLEQEEILLSRNLKFQVISDVTINGQRMIKLAASEVPLTKAELTATKAIPKVVKETSPFKILPQNLKDEMIAGTKSDGFERSIVLDSKGKSLIDLTIGDEAGVGGYHASLDVPGADVTIVHTHPFVSSFSPGDMITIARYEGVSKSIVIMPDGSMEVMHSISRKGKLLEKRVNELVTQHRMEWIDKLSDGLVTRVEAKAGIEASRELVLKQLEKEGFLVWEKGAAKQATKALPKTAVEVLPEKEAKAKLMTIADDFKPCII